MRHVIDKTSPDGVLEKEVEVTVENGRLFLSLRDHVNFDDLILQGDKLISVEVSLTKEDVRDIKDILEINVHKIEE